MKIKMNNRKIGYTYGSLSGYYPFRKEKSIAFESSLERDLIILLEFNDSVCDVIEQPLTIEYRNRKGTIVSYTPDFLVYFNELNSLLGKRIKRKPLLIEVKPRDVLKKDFHLYKDRFKQAIKYANKNEMIFKVFDETRIRTQYFANVKFLERYKELVFDSYEREQILALLNIAGNLSIEYLLEYFCKTREQRGIMLSHIWKLISNKIIECDLNHSLNLETQVWINKVKNEEESFNE